VEKRGKRFLNVMLQADPIEPSKTNQRDHLAKMHAGWGNCASMDYAWRENARPTRISQLTSEKVAAK